MMTFPTEELVNELKDIKTRLDKFELDQGEIRYALDRTIKAIIKFHEYRIPKK